MVKKTSKQADPSHEAWAVENIPVDQIEVSGQLANPRSLKKNDPNIRLLADSINGVGLLQPILLQSVPSEAPEKSFQLIAGRRRLAAVQLSQMPWNVKDPGLHPVRGACETCELRSDVQKDLFFEPGEKARTITKEARCRPLSRTDPDSEPCDTLSPEETIGDPPVVRLDHELRGRFQPSKRGGRSSICGGKRKRSPRSASSSRT